MTSVIIIIIAILTATPCRIEKKEEEEEEETGLKTGLKNLARGADPLPPPPHNAIALP
jgi:hypothetical protein